MLRGAVRTMSGTLLSVTGVSPTPEQESDTHLTGTAPVVAAWSSVGFAERWTLTDGPRGTLTSPGRCGSLPLVSWLPWRWAVPLMRR